MRFHVLTLFPNLFSAFLGESLVGKAIKRGLLEIELTDIRDHTGDPHRTADDRPYGGGPGMVMLPAPIASALDGILSRYGTKPTVIALSPGGCKFHQGIARELSLKKAVVLICGRYQGIDQRVLDLYCDMELSIGDYVLSGGEIPAMAVIESVARLIPGFVGDPGSTGQDSFATGLLEYPQYTRPRVFRGIPVPEPLLSGNHKEIELFRREEALRRTRKARPDLLGNDEPPASGASLPNGKGPGQAKGPAGD
ncbi:MAG: tRNA (guanosine(37)-N1)-methyltransferase TrmD [Deltaproteobacteria bacterium]|nr:tRNA (guanosine(37)-N1)-methyltransferase TrmD [Deltaproteobacteria bacterium]